MYRIAQGRTVLTLVRQARRRLLYNGLLSQGANAASAALFAFILLLLLGTQVLSWQWTVLLPLAAGALGVYRARKRLPTPYRVAQIVDRRTNLEDSLSTALYFSQEHAARSASPEIRRLQSERADRAAETVDVRQAIPYTMPRTVYLMAALFLVASSLFALRYGLIRRLDLKQPLASMLQQSFGSDNPVRQAKNQKKLMKQPDPETRPDDSGDSVQEPDQRQGDQQDADNATAEETGDAQKPSGEQKAADAKKQGDEGEKSDAEQQDSQGDDRSGDEGEDSQSTKSSDGKSDQKQDSNAQQDSNNNAGENSSLMSKVKDFAQNLLSRVKPQQGQSGSQQQQQSSGDQKSQGKGQQSGGKQQNAKEGQPQNGQQGDAQEGQAGEQAQSAQDQQGKGTGKSDAQQPSKQPGSGIGSQDGDKSIKQAEDQAAMGKISEIFGKRSATISGESMLEVQQTSQQLRTPYAQRSTEHAQNGAEIRRDEVPVALQSFVEQYFEQVRKQAPASGSTTPAPPKK